MKYVVLLSKSGKFEFTLGQVGVTKGNIAIRDADGSAKVFQGEEIMAMMRSDLFDLYEDALKELESLKSNRNGHDRQM